MMYALRLSGRHAVLCEYPLQAPDGQLSHVLYRICSGHDDIHARETPHGTHVHHIVLHFTVAEPCCHQVLHAVHGSRSHCRLLVRFRDAQVESGKPLIHPRNIYPRLQPGMINRKTLYNFHKTIFFF